MAEGASCDNKSAHQTRVGLLRVPVKPHQRVWHPWILKRQSTDYCRKTRGLLIDLTWPVLPWAPSSRLSVEIPSTMVRTEGLYLLYQTIPYKDGNTMPIL